MKKNILAISLVCSLVAAEQVCAADDVYVDLSVLDTIPQDSIGFVSSEPLFPEIKKTRPIIKHKVKKTAKKIVVKKPAVKKTVIEKAVKKAETVKPVESEKIENKEQQAVPQTEINREPLKTEVTQNILSQDVAESVENKPSLLISQENTEETSPVEDKSAQTEEKTVSAETSSEQDIKPVESSIVEEDKSVNIENTPNEAEETLNKDNESLSASLSDKEQAVDSEPMLQPKEIYAVSFEPDSYELTAEATQKLDKMAQIFDTYRKKKISIKAYNYDDGVESFRKKRISLNRATEIRSYFLNHGFKNFSIKIINTTADNEYKDTVEIEEIN